MQYTYDADILNIPDTHQSFSVIFGGIAAFVVCGVLIYKACKYGYAFATLEDPQYIHIKKIPAAIRSKNLYTSLVFSKSKHDNNKPRKIWFYKPISSEHIGHVYDLESATKEVYFGTLTVELFGKEYAAKIKFNVYDAGIVSRVIGDDATKVIDLFNFCLQKKSFPVAVQKQFLKVIILGIIFENRDMRLENLVVSLDHNNNPSCVYMIDQELSGSEALGKFRPMVDVLYRISNNPKQIINLLMDKTFKWNYAENRKNFEKSAFDLYAEALLSSITPQECLDVMDMISRQLAANDFSVCLGVKQKVLGKLAGYEYEYPSDTVKNTIIPTIDRAIGSVAENVKMTDKFLAQRASRLVLI
jgi:hypothetical protein